MPTTAVAAVAAGGGSVPLCDDVSCNTVAAFNLSSNKEVGTIARPPPLTIAGPREVKFVMIG